MWVTAGYRELPWVTDGDKWNSSANHEGRQRRTDAAEDGRRKMEDAESGSAAEGISVRSSRDFSFHVATSLDGGAGQMRSRP